MAREKLEAVSIVYAPRSRRLFLKGSAGLLGMASLGGILQACGAAASPSPPPAGTPTVAPTAGDPTAAASPTAIPISTVDFQIRWLKEVSFGGWFAGIENGYFRDEGIDLNVIAGGPNLDVQQIIAGGNIPIGEGITDRILLGRVEQNVPFKIIGALYQRSPASFMSFAEKNIATPADMVGKRIATTAEGRPLVEALFQNAGLPPTDWTFVPSGFDPSPIVNDEADLFHGFRTGQGNLLELQGESMNYVTYDQFDFPVYDAPIFVLEDTLAEQEDLLVRWMRASIKGWEYAVANPEEVSELTVSKYGHEGIDPAVSENEAKLQIDDIVSPDTDQRGLFTMTEERWQTVLDFFVAAGTLTNEVPASDIMTTAIQEQAMGGMSSLLEG